MSTPANEIPAVQAPASQLPLDVPSLHQIILNMGAKLMAHSQTVSELLNANMQIRAALHLAQTDKAQLEAMVKGFLAPAAAAAPAVEAPAEAPAVDNGAVLDHNVPDDATPV